MLIVCGVWGAVVGTGGMGGLVPSWVGGRVDWFMLIGAGGWVGRCGLLWVLLSGCL